LPSADIEPVDPVRPGEDETCDEVFGAAELQPVRPPDGQIRALAGRELPDVGSAEDSGAATRAEAERRPGVEVLRAAAGACDEERLFDFEEEIAAFVRGGAVDAEADTDARVEQVADTGDAGPEAHVRGRTVRDADVVRTELRDVVVGKVDAMRTPDVAREPAELLEVLDRRAAVELAAVLLFLDRLREVGVQRQ